MKLSELAGILSFRGDVEVVSLERDRMVVKRAKRVRDLVGDRDFGEMEVERVFSEPWGMSIYVKKEDK